MMNILNKHKFIKQLFKTVVSFLLFYGFCFISLVILVMSDEGPHTFAKYLYKFIKWVCGFPLVLFDNDWPFFLDSTKPPVSWISYFAIITTNAFIQSVIVISFRCVKKQIK